jgi:hypothetical protein
MPKAFDVSPGPGAANAHGCYQPQLCVPAVQLRAGQGESRRSDPSSPLPLGSRSGGGHCTDLAPRLVARPALNLDFGLGLGLTTA